MSIQTSLDWNSVEIKLNHQSRQYRYKSDIKRLLLNTRKKVSELSKAEVMARRTSYYKATQLLNDINADIVLIEEYLVVAALLG